MPGTAAGSVLDLVYPRICAGCGGTVDMAAGHTCWECLRTLDIIKAPFCRICGDPADGVAGPEYDCPMCLDRRPWFDAARSVFRYRGPMKGMIYNLKYGNGVYLRNEIAEHLKGCVANHFGRVHFDSVSFVPLHGRRERERGYNQSQLIAAPLARLAGLDLESRCLRRARHTETQTDLDASGRRRNVRGAFEAVNPRWIDGRRFLLVDDVMTTGATVDECARVLKKSGAVSVHAVTLARG